MAIWLNLDCTDGYYASQSNQIHWRQNKDNCGISQISSFAPLGQQHLQKSKSKRNMETAE
jgi:hypothetical protein